MPEVDAGVKYEWVPRRWMNTRSVALTPDDPAMGEYYGQGLIRGHNTLIEMSPRKLKPFTNLPANHLMHFAWRINYNFYIVLSKTAAQTSLSVGFYNTATATYTAQTFVPAGDLIIGTVKPEMVASTLSGPYYFTSFSHGLLKITGGNVTQVTSATTLQTVSQHISRLVGLTSDASYATIKYSVPGNFDDWTTTANGAGSVTLILNNEALRGLRVVGNTLVILGNRSIFIGYPTGVTSPPYRIEQILSNSDVLQDSRTLVQHENTLYYKGATNIYKFENYKQEAIDQGQLFNVFKRLTANIMSGGVCYNLREMGVNLEGERFIEEPHYILFPVTVFQDSAQPPMFFNIKRQEWANCFGTQNFRLSDDTVVNNAFVDLVEPLQSDFGLNEPLELIHQTDQRNLEYISNGPSSAHATIVKLYSPEMQVGDASKEYALNRILVKYSLTTSASDPASKLIRFNINCVHRITNEVTTGFIDVNLKTTTVNNRPREQWINLANKNLTGNFFRLDIEYTQVVTYRMEWHAIEFYFAEAGDLVDQ